MQTDNVNRLLVAACFGLTVCLSFLLLPVVDALASIVLSAAMIGIAYYDARHYIIPDFLSLGAFAVGVCWAVTAAHGGFSVDAGIHHLFAAFVAAALMWFVRYGYWLFRRIEGLGLGDVKLALAAGAWTGFPGFAHVLLFACFFAFAAILAVRIFGRAPLELQDKIPFGLFFAPAIWLVWFVQHLPLELSTFKGLP